MADHWKEALVLPKHLARQISDERFIDTKLKMLTSKMILVRRKMPLLVHVLRKT